MTIRPRRLGISPKLITIAALATSAIGSSGCGGDDPSQFAGTIEPEPRKSKLPDAKSTAKIKAGPGGSNR